MTPTRAGGNRLAQETSPYLLQHAQNPVDWHAWGQEAIERARREDKPIFLSIGYSACHWCHVMEHESFEDPEIAALMNEYFVNIKVDREERPDLDQIYMNAVQMMTRHGGWPMSVFLTPDLEPFYGGTYFPPSDRMGMPGFRRILVGVADAWKNRRDEVTRSGAQLAGALRQMNELAGNDTAPSLELVDRAVSTLARSFDRDHGGFGGAPKFPHPMDLRLCLRHARRTGSEQSLEMVTTTLDHMARGGIYDQLGGGFHRYSTDERWLVPHFEKMLYDNALLAQTYLEAYQAVRRPEFARVARQTLDYVLCEMTAPEGGFYSTQDADSEGVEGKFYVWSLAEINQMLDKEAAATFAYAYDVTAEGNWEGHNILQRPKTIEQCARLLGVDRAALERSLDASRARLRAARAQRVPPGRDDKVLVAWNGLMIDAMALGYQVLGEPRYLEAARRAAEFILNRLWRGGADTLHGAAAPAADAARPGAEPADGHLLLHSYKDGRARFNAYLDDYACLSHALVTLYESDFQPHWIAEALELTAVMIDQFWDESGKSFFYTGRSHEPLVARTRDVHDTATPSGNSMAVTALARLGKLTGHGALVAKAEETLRSFTGLMEQMPAAVGQMLLALHFLLDHPSEIAIVPGESPGQADEAVAALRAVRDRFLPNKVVALRLPGPARAETERLLPLLANRPAVAGQTTVYLCENNACRAPIIGAQALAAALDVK